jgi:carbohydrate diacid regulator
MYTPTLPPGPPFRGKHGGKGLRAGDEGAAVSRITVPRTVREVFRDRQDVAGEQAAGRYVAPATAHGERAAPGRLTDACGQLLSPLNDRHGLDGRMAADPAREPSAHAQAKVRLT